MTKEQTIKELTIIPGVGKSLATDLWNIGITSIADLKGQNPNKLYDEEKLTKIIEILEGELKLFSNKNFSK